MAEDPGEERRCALPGVPHSDRPIQEQLDEFSALVESLPGISPNPSADDEIQQMYALMRKYPNAAREYAARWS